jgi:hypothetical protein
MRPFLKHLLYTAIASMGTLAAIDAQAVNVSPDGRGQVLLYPYYTTRSDAAGNAYGTLLSVINATSSAKAVRVRFLEGKNSREVLDFNLFLSPFDVWAAAVLPDPVTGGARIGTTDLSCTLPAFSASPTSPYVSFANAGYSGTNDDGAGTSLDRMKEGYFEIIEMATYSPVSISAKAITHVKGVPSCRVPAGPISPNPPFLPTSPAGPITDMQAAMDALPPSGGLFGALTLINVNAGTDYTADAVALANFYQGGANYHASTEALPDLTQATPAVSGVYGPDGRLYESTWTAGTADAVSATLMHDTLMNEFVLDIATVSGTDWVVTMPTKRFYVNIGPGNAPKLFQRNFNKMAGSCDDLSLNVYDREEESPPAPNPFDPSPVINQVCWEANVITFNNSNVLGSTNSYHLPDLVQLQNGWMNLGFPRELPGTAANSRKLINSGATVISGGGRATTTGNTTTYAGLPVIGFAVISFTNGTLQVGTPPASILSNYGGNFAHKSSTTIQ